MSKLHILFIASWYPHPGNPTHGIFNRLFVSAAAQHARVSVLYVSADKKQKEGFKISTEEEPDIFTVRVVYPESAGRRSVINKAIQYRRRIQASEKGFDLIKQKCGLPDLVQLNVILPAGPAALHLCRKYSIPYVINEGWTGYDPEDGRYKGVLTKYLTRKVIGGASCILPVTDYLSGLMQRHGLKGNYRVIPNIIDTSVFLPAGSPAKSGTPRFLHVSALDDEQKNVSGIIRALAQAHEKVGEIELLIVGEGDGSSSLKKLVSSLAIEKQVTFAGSKTPGELAKLFSEVDALVMFSNYETFCVVIPEALACGVPVITSDAGGIMSYFDETLGLVVPRRDENALAEAMVIIASKKFSYDPAALRNFVSERFSKEVVSRMLLEVYHSVLKG
jgi:glycosyltransferase involved in cell wall biosynthesis